MSETIGLNRFKVGEEYTEIGNLNINWNLRIYYKFWEIRDVFRTLSNILDGAYFKNS